MTPETVPAVDDGPARVCAPAELVDRPPRVSWRAWYAAGLVVADMAGAMAAVVICYLARGAGFQVDILYWHVPYGVLAGVSLPVWLIGQALYGSYRPVQSGEDYREYREVVVVGLRLMAAAAVASFALKANLSRMLVVVYFPALIVASLVARWLLRRSLSLLRRRGRAVVEVMLVGDSASVRKVADHLYPNAWHGYVLAGVCIPGDERSLAHGRRLIPVLGHPDEVVSAARQAGVGAVAVTNVAQFESLTLQRLAWQLERSGIDLLIAPSAVDIAGPRIRVTPLTGPPLLHIPEPRVDCLARRLIGAASRTLAVPLTLLLSPLMLVIALLVMIDSGRPIFYRQVRVGYRGRTFEMLKFRTMVPDADRQVDLVIHLNEHDGPLFKCREDPRVTRVGHWLRKYSLDELPQLFNILRGQMVYVGPRPCLPTEIESFGEAEQRRFFAKPGMTGIWQVSGRATVPWEDAVKMDLYYVEHWTPALDLLILFRTLRVVASGSGS